MFLVTATPEVKAEHLPKCFWSGLNGACISCLVPGDQKKKKLRDEATSLLVGVLSLTWTISTASLHLFFPVKLTVANV